MGVCYIEFLITDIVELYFLIFYLKTGDNSMIGKYFDYIYHGSTQPWQLPT